MGGGNSGPNDGLRPRLQKLKDLGFKIILFTGNTRGDANDLAKSLGIEWRLAKSADDKADLTRQLGAETCASIGNGLIDNEMMGICKLRILTLQAEGVHVQTLLNSDIIVPHLFDALDLFIDPQNLIATLRK